MTNRVTKGLFPNRYYVINIWANRPDEYIMSGPFDTAQRAEQVRQQMPEHMADDGIVAHYAHHVLADGRTVGRFRSIPTES